MSWVLAFELFNLLFVVIAQLVVILGFTSPAVLDLYEPQPWNLLDTVALVVFVILLGVETLADHQMFRFQRCILLCMPPHIVRYIYSKRKFAAVPVATLKSDQHIQRAHARSVNVAVA